MLLCASDMHAISSVMNHRLVTSSPLLFKQDDYSKHEDKSFSFELQPWVSGMYDVKHTMENLGINGKTSMTLNQQGLGDMNPEFILLGATDIDRNYSSTINLTPSMLLVGGLFHIYKQFEHVFLDVRTALINCRTQICIEELGGGNGGMSQPDGTVITNAYQAFTQADWNYGKIGDLKTKTGLDNIQVMFGYTQQMDLFSSDSCDSYFAGFGLLEIPIGKGTQGEWLFEPQVGTNHCAFGFGTDFMFVQDHGGSLVFGGNYRYMISNWERRSFDLSSNGLWSRYLGLDTIDELGTEGPVNPLQGINLFTQDALIDGRSQVTLYTRLEKRWEHCLFEFSYNFFYTQKELISQVDTIASGFGIYDVFTSGGVSTSHLAQIWQANTTLDATPVTLVTSDLDLVFGAAGAWMSNMVAGRLQSIHDTCTLGIGASAEMAHSAQALSSWSVWANFEVLLP